MTINLTAVEAQAMLLAPLDEVAAGVEIEITTQGRTLARLVPAIGSPALKGLLAGIATTSAPDEDLFETEASWDRR